MYCCCCYLLLLTRYFLVSFYYGYCYCCLFLSTSATAYTYCCLFLATTATDNASCFLPPLLLLILTRFGDNRRNAQRGRRRRGRGRWGCCVAGRRCPGVGRGAVRDSPVARTIGHPTSHQRNARGLRGVLISSSEGFPIFVRARFCARRCSGVDSAGVLRREKSGRPVFF